MTKSNSFRLFRHSVACLIFLSACCGTVQQIRHPYDQHAFGYTDYTGDYIQAKPRTSQPKHTGPAPALVYLDFIETTPDYVPVLHEPATGDREEREMQTYLANSVISSKVGEGTINRGYERTNPTFEPYKRAILEKVNELCWDFQLAFTLTQPDRTAEATKNFITVRIAPHNRDFLGQSFSFGHGLQSYALWDPNDQYRNEVVYVWSYSLENAPAVARQIAHTFGLEDLQPDGFIMSASGNGTLWATGPTAVHDAFEAYGRDAGSVCAGKVPANSFDRKQDDVAILNAAVGKREPVKKPIPVNEPKSCYMPGYGKEAPLPLQLPDKYDLQQDGSINVIKQGLVLDHRYVWAPGTVLDVAFIQRPSARISEAIMLYAKTWERYANITFNFIEDVNRADVRIAFNANGWAAGSAVRGRMIEYVPAPNATMTYDTTASHFLDIPSSQPFLGGLILHEFGHTLGFMHEHQSPAAAIPWDTAAVYHANRNMPRDKVDSDILTPASQSTTNFSHYDSSSVMHYYIPANWTLDGKTYGKWKPVLSDADKQFAARWYPFPESSSGILRTNDDCDEIEFTVEYVASIPDGQVEIVLRLDPDYAVTWWKGVSVTFLHQAREYELYVQDDRNSETASFLLSQLDVNKPMRFAKAKFLGVHTKLNYTWDILRYVKPKTRITLSWQKDHCP